MKFSWAHSDDVGTDMFESVEEGFMSHQFQPLTSNQNPSALQSDQSLDEHGSKLPVPLEFDQIGRFNEEWFWVFGYGTTSVLVIIANTMMLCSIIKNAFLHTNTHRYVISQKFSQLKVSFYFS